MKDITNIINNMPGMYYSADTNSHFKQMNTFAASLFGVKDIS
jgi:hypothetical protein